MNQSERERHQSIETGGATPQYGGQTLEELKYSVQDASMQLFSRALAGGLMGARLTEGYPIHVVSDSLLRSLQLTYDAFMQLCGGTLIGSICPEDRQTYQETVRRAIMEGPADWEIEVRVVCGNSYRWMQEVGTRTVDQSGQELLLLLRLDVTEAMENRLELERKAKQFEERSRRLELLAANIPGGMCELDLDAEFTLLYGNEGFYRSIGYTSEQLERESRSRLLRVIALEDRARVSRAVEQARKAGEQLLELEVRVNQRDGSVVWMLVRGNFTTGNGRSILNCVVVDITDRKRIEQDLRINEERFRIALAQTDNTIFDYEIETRRMIHGDRSADAYGLRQLTEGVPESLVETKVVHPDSAEAFLDMYRKIVSGEKSASCVVRARVIDGEYVWRKISMTNVFNGDGKPVRAVGILEDIDAQTRLEQELRYQSERDALTNLYNRRATQKRIVERLELRQEEKLDALFVIDIDVFKAINDQYGHMFGDFVLTEGARRIAGLFHNQDVIGRIGGDEFMVFMSQIPNISTAYRRAQRICSAFQDPFVHNGSTALVSCSMGIAFCPRDGATFLELYQRADIALYDAKRNGKSRCVLFRPEMFDGSEWLPYSSTAIDNSGMGQRTESL